MAISKLRRSLPQFSTTQRSGLNSDVLRQLMEAELQSEERIAERNHAWELQAEDRKIAADAAKASGLVDGKG